MHKTERLDRVLIRLGYVTQEDVERAVARQKERGGRFGENLVALDALTEEQLYEALVEQFRIPTIKVDRSSVPEELLDKMPKRQSGDSLIVPVGWNEDVGVLSLAVSNPADTESIEAVRKAFNARKVRVSLAPEAVLSDLYTQLGRKAESSPEPVRLVALPELFEAKVPEEENTSVPEPVEGALRRVVMVSRGAVRKNFLPAIFRPEGCELTVASTPQETREAMVGAEAVLVDAEMQETFTGWVRSGAVPPPPLGVTVFSSVSEALLENPVPYTATSASLRSSIQSFAEYRCAEEGVSPPYTLMAYDLEAVARRIGLGAVAVDGLIIGLHLLMPVEDSASIEPFRSFPESLSLARRLRFPWAIDTLLGHCLNLYLGSVDLEDVAQAADEALVAAQVLALVWFRYHFAETDVEGADDPTAALRTTLRRLAGRFATLNVIEAYLEVIEEGGDVAPAPGNRRVLLVGSDRLARAFTPALTGVGLAVSTAQDVASAQAAVEEIGPCAVIIEHAELRSETEKICRVLALDGTALLFVIADRPDPGLVLSLLDLGVEDVFGAPHDVDVVSARIHRAIRSRPKATDQDRRGEFSARFEAFSFLDLVQMLANGLKSVRVDLRRDGGESAVLFLAGGRPVHARCGVLSGADAVYRVITWQDNGEFTVSQETDFPGPNIDGSVESLLMEGVRRLDESLSGAARR